MPELTPDETILQMMELIEAIDTVLLVAGAVASMPLEVVDQEDWNTIQESMQTNCELLEAFKKSLSIGSKLVDNPAVMSHMTAVIEAE